MFKRNVKIGRRIMGGALLSREAAAEQSAQRNVNTPVGAMASVYCAAATANFLAVSEKPPVE